MTEAKRRFDSHVSEAAKCIDVFDSTGFEFALRHVWVVCVSAFDLFMSELVSEGGLRLIDRSPPVLTANLRTVQIALHGVMSVVDLSPVERLLFYKDQIYANVQFKSFYRPDKVSEALSYIWICPAKEKWGRILARLRDTGRYDDRTEEMIRGELTLIGDRRDIIAHSVDTPPGLSTPNLVDRDDAFQVYRFIRDLAESIDAETEYQINNL